MTTAELNAEFFRQMSYIADDENSNEESFGICKEFSFTKNSR